MASSRVALLPSTSWSLMPTTIRPHLPRSPTAWKSSQTCSLGRRCYRWSMPPPSCRRCPPLLLSAPALCFPPPSLFASHTISLAHILSCSKQITTTIRSIVLTGEPLEQFPSSRLQSWQTRQGDRSSPSAAHRPESFYSMDQLLSQLWLIHCGRQQQWPFFF